MSVALSNIITNTPNWARGSGTESGGFVRKRKRSRGNEPRWLVAETEQHHGASDDDDGNGREGQRPDGCPHCCTRRSSGPSSSSSELDSGNFSRTCFPPKSSCANRCAEGEIVGLPQVVFPESLAGPRSARGSPRERSEDHSSTLVRADSEHSVSISRAAGWRQRNGVGPVMDNDEGRWGVDQNNRLIGLQRQKQLLVRSHACDPRISAPTRRRSSTRRGAGGRGRGAAVVISSIVVTARAHAYGPAWVVRYFTRNGSPPRQPCNRPFFSLRARVSFEHAFLVIFLCYWYFMQ